MRKSTVAKAPQALKRIECSAHMSELKLRPPKNLLAVCSGLLAIAAGALMPLHAGQQQSAHPLRSQTDLVTILASVTDASNRPVPDLTEDAFQISEEGAPQKIERFEAQTDRPLDLALMVDSSISAFKDLHFETDAAAHFIKQVLRPGDTLSVFEFAENVTRLADFSGDVGKLQSAVRGVTPGAGTSIYDAIVLGSGALRGRPTDRRRAIVLVTDGGETTSVSKFDQSRRAGVKSGALLYTVLIRPVKTESGRNTAGEHALITITDSMGGDMFTLDDMSQMQDIFDQIDRELRTQYLIAYYPQPSPPPGSNRHIALAVTGGYNVRYRKEYYTPALTP
jgi:Ca-activated chloride channel homolog